MPPIYPANLVFFQLHRAENVARWLRRRGDLDQVVVGDTLAESPLGFNRTAPLG